MDTIKLIRDRMTDEDVKLLSDIHAPTEVAVPDDDAWGGLTLMRDGRIRHYGHYQKKSVYDTDYERCYIESCDGGLSWKRHIDDKRRLGASVYVPFLDKYITVRAFRGRGPVAYLGNDPDDDAPESYEASQNHYFDVRTPFVMRSRKRILVIVHEMRPELHPTAYFPVLLISDDGKRWREKPLEAAPFYPAQDGEGLRWQQNNRENTIEERSDGTLIMISRTACDFHHICYSFDGGETWSRPEPSTFHGTGTMPLLKRLSDGRMLFFWCNTRLLPELPEADGKNEDVFTNRDANHVAISEDDGKHWIGFREMALNPLRNHSDFRSVGGPEDDRDKSVHQFEALELPLNRVLVVYGQHKVCRKIVIFDLDWLYERNRQEDFLHGLISVSTQTYVKSILGGHRGRQDNPNAYVGHCAYNRTHGALLVPSPENDGHEVLHICRTDDERLVSNVGGAVWNFPAAKRGSIFVGVRIEGDGLRVSLLDHWVNPCDPTVRKISNISAQITAGLLSKLEPFTEVRIDFDCTMGAAALYVNHHYISRTRIHGSTPNGLCYLHLQSAAEKPDLKGCLISYMRFEAHP